MSHMKSYLNYLVFVLIFIFISCDYYLGMNQQPLFEDENIDEGLNIFGLLRPDSIENFNRSFVFVQQIWSALEFDSLSIMWQAEIRVEHLVDNNTVESVDFPMVPPDLNFSDSLYRPLDHFIPLPGERYRLICQYEGFPDAVGETVIPSKPGILDNSLEISERNVSFTLVADTLIKMLDVYLVGNNNSWFINRIVPVVGMDADVELELPVDPTGMVLTIYSYDVNLAAYYGNANTSLNFNKYRTTITTLQSGYGVFGSLNYVTIPLGN
jgi:hypothetical protein